MINAGIALDVISIHAPRVGSDCLLASGRLLQIYFNPRSPCGERPFCLFCQSLSFEFQSTLPVWGATKREQGIHSRPGISIHAPRVGSDDSVPDRPPRGKHFNPRSPCGERHLWNHCRRYAAQFQSTLPVWGATLCAAGGGHAPADFNPRSPCGERLRSTATRWRSWPFQSTLPVWGATKCTNCMIELPIFQSTLPVWGATSP